MSEAVQVKRGPGNPLGRPIGIKEKLPRRTKYRDAVVSGLAIARRYERMPLDIMMAIVNDLPWAKTLTALQVQCAIAAAPYVHPKLNAVAFTDTTDTASERRRDMLRQLPYQRRQEILAILAEAQQRQLEGVAEAITEEDTNEPSDDTTA